MDLEGLTLTGDKFLQGNRISNYINVTPSDPILLEECLFFPGRDVLKG